jgi:predicted  nucleic acid-binding Zn-ribbon protein
MFDTEEERLDSNLNSFLVESLNLKEIAKDIDAYIESNQPAALAKVERDIKATSNRFKAKQKEIEALKPQLERMQKMVDDQENQKNNLAHNIRLITVQEEITKIDEEIETLMQKRAGIERADTIDGDMEALDDKKKSLVSSIARLDGRKGEIIEQIRGLKV